MKHILVVSVNWLGDAVFSTPVFFALKKQYPGARITCLCVPRVVDVLSLCPAIDKTIVYDEEGVDRPWHAKLSLITRLRREKFDAAFILRRSFSRSLILALAGIPVRVGYAKKGWRGLLTHEVSSEGMDRLHRSDAYLRVIETYGVKVDDRSCCLSAQEAVIRGWKDRFAAMGVKAGERLIAINTGGNWDLKQWPVERFVTLIQDIHARKLGRVVLPGAPKDIERVRKIKEASGVGDDLIMTAGNTGITSLAGLFSCVDTLVTADTGPLHLAAALGVKTVALFGPTRPEVTGARGQKESVVLQKDVGCNKAPCYYLECKNNKCMKAIMVEDVLCVL